MSCMRSSLTSSAPLGTTVWLQDDLKTFTITKFDRVSSKTNLLCLSSLFYTSHPPQSITDMRTLGPRESEEAETHKLKYKWKYLLRKYWVPLKYFILHITKAQVRQLETDVFEIKYLKDKHDV